MSPEFDDPGAEEIYEFVKIDIKAAIACYNEERNPIDLAFLLMNTGFRVWDNLTTNDELRQKIESKMDKVRSAMNEIAPITSEPENDPISRRYNPYKWIEKLPEEYAAGGANKFLVSRLKTFLEFLENL